MPNDVNPLYDPTENTDINVEAESVAEKLLGVEESMRRAKKSYTFTNADMNGTYEKLSNLLTRVRTMKTSTFTEKLILFDVSHAKTSIEQAITDSISKKLYSEHMELEKLLSNAFSKLSSIKSLIDRIPETPEQWKQQIEVYRNRDKLAQDISTNVQSIILGKINFSIQSFSSYQSLYTQRYGMSKK